MFDLSLRGPLCFARERKLPTQRQVAVVTDILNWLAEGCTLRQSMQLLYSAAHELKDKHLVVVLEQVQQGLNEGKTLAQALKPWVNETLYVMLSNGGETEVILGSVARYQLVLDEQAALKKAIVAKLTYPLILFLVALVATFVVGGQLLPRFAQLLGEHASSSDNWPLWSRCLGQVAALLPFLTVALGVVVLSLVVSITHDVHVASSRWLFWLPQTRLYHVYKGWCAIKILNQLSLLLARGLNLGQATDVLARSTSGLAARHVEFMRQRLVQGEVALSDIMNSGLLDRASTLRLKMAAGRNQSRAEQLMSIANGLTTRTITLVTTGLQQLVVFCYGLALMLFALITLGLGQMILTLVTQWQ